MPTSARRPVQLEAFRSELQPYRNEKDVQKAVWRLLGLAGCGRWWFSQVRKTQQTKGIPDLLAVHPRHGMAWIECKHPTNPSSKQSPEQLAFEGWCVKAGVTYLVVRDPQQVADWLGVGVVDHLGSRFTGRVRW